MSDTIDTQADPRAVASWSHDLPDEFLLCRDIGHQWRPFTARYLPQRNVYERTLRCGRCTTTRRQTVSLSGEISSGGYEYADGYVAPAGQGRLTGRARGALRLESIGRLIGRESN
jgi:hypothetical protein